MKIVIPMSGSGTRFLKAGYTVPKPLIEVDGKPLIEHVVNMYPGEKDIIFISFTFIGVFRGKTVNIAGLFNIRFT